MHPLHGECHGWRALLNDAFAVDHLHGQAVFAAIDVDQLQDRHVARLAVGLVVQQQSQLMRRLQARFDQDIDREGAVVGAQRFVSGQTGEFEDFIGVARWLRCFGAG